MRTAKFEDLEELLFACFKEVRESKVPFDVKIIKDKANRIAQELDRNFLLVFILVSMLFEVN